MIKDNTETLEKMPRVKGWRKNMKQQQLAMFEAVHPPPAMTDCLEVKAPAHTS